MNCKKQVKKQPTSLSLSTTLSLTRSPVPAMICSLPEIASLQEKLSPWLPPVRTILRLLLAKDSRAWNEIGTATGTVTFYAHYPALTDEAATRSGGNKRYLKGGQEHLFGTAEAAPGSQNVSLKFKRMTVPVIILDENDRPYEGEAKVELSLKNEGTQDLLNGTIEINENALSENIEVKKVSEGVTTNVLPQKINAGEEIGTITVGGVTQKISAVEDLDLKAGSTLSVRLSKKFGGGIIDGNVPLYR